MRQVLTIVVPLLLPTALYFIYLAVAGRNGAAAAGSPADRIPWVWLGVAGAVLMVLTFVAVTQFGGAPPGSRYEPAQLIDGKIQPGGFQ